MKSRMILLIACICCTICSMGVWAQDDALTDVTESRHAVLRGIDMGDVHWTTGFWARRFEVCRDSMIPHLWRIYHDKQLCHGYENFLIAAGIDTGSHEGPPFHDGDFYKLLEGIAAVYAVTKDHRLDSMMDQAIAVIAAFYRKSTPQLARNAICPSHYMGIIELYRTTHDPVYLQLAKNLIDIRGRSDDGTDDNQDRVPFRDQMTAMGHAVRANYLYAGVADVVAETGDDSLYHCLKAIWKDITDRKMYITGGCGALYDGVSPDATSYQPARIQEVHQAYGLDGDRYFYTNPLRVTRAFPYTLRWSGGRQEYIALSNCCPPNLARTIAEVADYVYCANDRGLWVNLYGANRLDTHLPQGVLRLDEATEYPWDGKVKITIRQAPSDVFSIFLRIPGWCDKSSVSVNGQRIGVSTYPGTFAEIHRVWKTGDVILLQLPMRTELIECNPLVEETRGQVAVRRGPVVYCLESPDMPAAESIFRVALPWRTDLRPVPMTIGKTPLMALEGEAWLLPGSDGGLYRELPSAPSKPVRVRLIPYYAWANRGPSDMTVWIDLAPAR